MRQDVRLDSILEALVKRASERYGELAVPRDAYAAYLTERVGDADCQALHTDELYLCCGCALGLERALTRFEREHGKSIDTSLASLTLSPAEREETRQLLRELLFVDRPARPAKIREYGGRGSLKGWVRAVAVRTGMNRVEALRGKVFEPEEELINLAALSADPELALMHELYLTEFREAFRAATRALKSEDATALRQYYLDGLPLERLAPLWGVHASTMCRRLQRARDTLWAQTQERLQVKLQMPENEVQSILRLIQSKLSMSWTGPLEPETPTPSRS